MSAPSNGSCGAHPPRSKYQPSPAKFPTVLISDELVEVAIVVPVHGKGRGKVSNVYSLGVVAGPLSPEQGLVRLSLEVPDFTGPISDELVEVAILEVAFSVRAPPRAVS